jgi:iron(III) transport system permease protein
MSGGESSSGATARIRRGHGVGDGLLGSVRSNWMHWTLAILLFVFFGLFLIWPIVQVLATGFMDKNGGFTLAYVRLIFSDATLMRGLFNAVVVGASVTGLCAAIAVPLAILTVRYDFPGRRWLGGLLLVPLILPPFVGGLGLRLMLGRLGPLTVLLGYGHGAGIDWLGRYRLAGVILVETLHLYPVMLLNVQAALANLDPAMEQAAANLGASRWTTFRRITLPLIRPGLFAGATLTLIWSFTELGTPLIFDFDTITPVQVYRLITDVSDNPLPYALVVVVLLASGVMYAIGKLLLGQPYATGTTRATTASAVTRLRGWPGLAATAAFGGVFLLAIVPHVGVVLTSVTATGAWYRTILPSRLTTAHIKTAMTDDLAFSSVVNSIRYATVATAIALAVGLAAAIVIARSRLAVRRVIDTLAMMPLAVPGLVLSFGYLAMSMNARRWLLAHGHAVPSWVDVQENPAAWLIVAYAARRLPYVVRAIVAGLQQTPVDLELAAANLGASAGRVLASITLPLIAANVIAGAMLAFSFAMLEVSDSLILAQKPAYFPITRAILELSGRLGDGVYLASALGAWVMVLLALTIVAANSLMGKRLGAIFRV